MRRERKWTIAAKQADFQAIAEEFGIDQVTARLIRNRDVIGKNAVQEYLHGTLDSLHDPHQMKGCPEAAQILWEKIRAQKKIRIIGDYDADGVNASCIFLCALQSFCALVDYEIPDRKRDGYGLSRSLVERAAKEGVDTILTCDNGISAIDEIALAKELGMTVIVTDHHEVGKILPKADVIVDPHQIDCPYPFKDLCGAAVAWKVICILYELAGRSLQEARPYILFVGFATIEDIVDLRGENRILAREGLSLLREAANPGYAALCQVNALDPSSLTSYEVGYVLGPCINASGRLGTAKLAMQLLLSETRKEALSIAEELKELNDERKAMTEEAYLRAVTMIEKEKGLQNDRVLVLYIPDCHEGVAGIVAGRIREQYYRPTFVLTDSKEENLAKGSGRSIEPYSMFEEMQKLSDLFVQFGGHPMAAGFTIEKSRIEEMRRRLNENCTLTKEEMTEELLIDVPMPLYYISEKVIQELSLLEPIGKGNESPIFCERSVFLLSARLIGKEKDSVKLQVCGQRNCIMDAVLFHEAGEFRDYLTEKFGEREVQNLFWGRKNSITLDLAYYPQINTYRGIRSLQIKIKYYR